MVTMKDVAKSCGVSFSTVSKALKNSPEISIETKKNVLEIANKLGYRPNAAARTLKTNKTNTIGVIFEDTTGCGLQHEYFTQIFNSLKVEAESRGFDITFISSNLKENSNYYEHAKYRNVDGVAIVVTDFSRPDVIKLVESSIPTCTLDFIFDGHTAILSDNINGMKQLVEYVINCGHKKIALIHGESTSVTSKRVGSYCSVLNEKGISINPDYIVAAKYHDAIASEEATKKILELKDPPSCIIYPDDFAALGGMQVLHQNGLKIGKDISIVGYDGILISQILNPTLVTYQQNAAQLGTLLARELVNQIEKPNDFIPKVLKVEGKLLEGSSVMKIR